MDIMLLHGGGRTSDDWLAVSPLLERNGHRVAAVDLRPLRQWTWDGAVDDLGRTIAAIGFDQPAVVGHALGGLVAALWATRHPECPFAINFDGHTNPTGPFDGLSAGEEEAAGKAMRVFLDESATTPDLRRIVAEFDDLDLFDVYARARCPLLVVSSTRTDFEEMLPEPVSSAFAAHRRGFAKRLKEVASVTPMLTLAELPTGHDMHLEAPEEVARLILHMEAPC